MLAVVLLFSLLNARIHKTFDLNAFSDYRLKKQTPRNSDSEYLTFSQKIDHFDPNNTETFEQRYLFEDKYYMKSHMLFLYISGEQTLSTTAISNNWVSSLPFFFA